MDIEERKRMTKEMERKDEVRKSIETDGRH